MKHCSKIRQHYRKICRILQVDSNLPDTGALNVLLVLHGLRPSYWYDGPKLSASKLLSFLKYLSTWKSQGIFYKFDDGIHHLRDGKLIQEGPLIYHRKLLPSKLVSIIEKKDLSNTYQSPIFGEILGYQCQVNIYDKKIQECGRTIRFVVSNNQDTPCYLYSFICGQKISQELENQIRWQGSILDSLIKKIFPSYSVSAQIESNIKH